MHVRELVRIVDAIIAVLDRVHLQRIRVVVIAGLFLVALHLELTKSERLRMPQIFSIENNLEGLVCHCGPEID